MKNRILLVEDDQTLSMIITETLQRYGFQVVTANNGEAGLKAFCKYGADLIVSDVMMPLMDGFELGRRIRRCYKNVPLLFLTAKSEIDDIVQGFKLGANDYLKKPFKMLELIVRIEALLRRIVPEEKNRYEIGKYILELSTQTLSYKDKEVIELSLIEAKLLKELVLNIGQTVEASTMMKLIWQRDDPYSRNSLHGFIHKLRNALRHDSSISIINQRGIGYMLTIKQ